MREMDGKQHIENVNGRPMCLAKAKQRNNWLSLRRLMTLFTVDA